MKKPISAVRRGPSRLDMVWAGGSTAVLLVMLAGAAATLSLYFR
jgi:hypothetical protein